MDKHTFRDGAVYKNWKSKEGPCGNCEIHDNNLHPKTRPQFGGFTTDADLMLVNATPGSWSDNTEFGANGKERVYKDTPVGAFPEDDDEYGPKNPPDGIDDIVDIPEDADSRFLADPYGESFIQGSWPSLDRLQEKLFADRGGRLEISLRDTYYTNRIKCPELATENGKCSDASNRNQAADEACLEYLKREIEQIIEPDVILAENNSLNQMARILDHSHLPEFPGPYKSITEGKKLGDPHADRFDYAAYGENPTLIPLPQFSTGIQLNEPQIGKRMENYTGSSNNDARTYYYDELARRIKFELT